MEAMDVVKVQEALKAEGLETTPHDIRRALENTAEMPAGMDAFTVGRGLARFDRA